MTRHEIGGWLYPEREEVLAQLIEKHNIMTVIEIGVFLGKSTAFFAEKCDKVYCIDPFEMWEEGKLNGADKMAGEGSFYKQFWDNMIKLGIDNKVVPIIGTSEDVAKSHPDLAADMVYIDGAHDFRSVSQDIILWRGRAAKILCGDDYDSNWPQVKGAVTMHATAAQVKNGVWYKIL